jgi:hypothetical protein
LIALGFASYTVHLLATGTKTIGTITALRLSHDKDGNESFAPTFQFTDKTGATNIVDSSLFQSPNPYHVGDEVPVIYPPADPLSARSDHFTEHWLAPIVFTTFSAALLISIPIQKKWHNWRSARKRHTA